MFRELKQQISLIAIIGKKRELGKDNRLLWHIPEDLHYFKKMTYGKPVLMGQRTFESIGRLLPGRLNIVLTTNRYYILPEGGIIAHSLESAFEITRNQSKNDEIFVIGGGMIYAAALPYADRLYLTIVDAEDCDADVFFPDYSEFKNKISQEDCDNGEYKFSFVILEKK